MLILITFCYLVERKIELINILNTHNNIWAFYIEMAFTDSHSMLTVILTKINKIEDGVEELKTRITAMEEKVNIIQNTQRPQSQIAMVTNISTPEDKIKLLNQQTNADTQEDLLEAIHTRLIITDSGVFSILNGNITIYEYVADIIYEFDNNSQTNYIYGFSDSKSTLYFWNQSKKKWAKMPNTYLCRLFELIQEKIIIKYNELMTKDNSLKKECVENGDAIFAEDFEKKYKDFKKSIISKFV
tara:strand:- start:124 stop:852 length:729 start_codon:yes stop_codon:yes gene_type:complete